MSYGSHNMFSLEGRLAFISGAAGHLGEAMAIALAGAGAHVLLNGRDASKLERLAAALRAKGAVATPMCFDVADDLARVAAVAEIESTHGRLDILVNNAYAGRPGTVDGSTVEDFAAAYSISVTTAFRMVQLLRPALTRAGAGRAGGASVVNIATMYGVVSPDPRIYGDSGSDSPPYYGAAKAALLQLTRHLACHLASDKIRVNSISPGPFPRADLQQKNPAFYTELSKKNPMNRVGHPEEVAGPVVFLASDAASFITGANLSVDGGWTAW